MNRDFTESPSPEDPPSRHVEPLPERHRAFDEPQAEERSCQFAGSLEQLGVGSVAPPRWIQVHLAECLSCLNDFARLQSLNFRPDPVRRRWLGSGGPTPTEDGMRDFFQELGSFMMERKKFWLLPLVGILVLFGGLLVATQGSAVAPFIYALW
jgi:Family of unknown function (DUF5989)